MGERNSHAAAFRRWFCEFEAERKRRKIAPGRPVPGFPAPPPGPDELRDLLDRIGTATALAVLGVHRSTLARWLDGSVRVPPASFALLRVWAAGVLPGMGDDWRDFRFDGDRLVLPGGRISYTARELAGLPMLEAALRSSEEARRALESQLVEMTRRVDWGSANDAFTDPHDVRRRAYEA